MEDPWVLLGTVAVKTKRMSLGTMVTPLARRRSQIVAKHLTTLYCLSKGRAVIGVGLGGDINDFTLFGEPSDPRIRAAKLDDSLELIRKYWSDEPVYYEGEYYKVHGVDL